MKANAEVGVFGRELTASERDAAWDGRHEENLVFLRPAAEIKVLGSKVSESERLTTWNSGVFDNPP